MSKWHTSCVEISIAASDVRYFRSDCLPGSISWGAERVELLSSSCRGILTVKSIIIILIAAVYPTSILTRVLSRASKPVALEIYDALSSVFFKYDRASSPPHLQAVVLVARRNLLCKCIFGISFRIMLCLVNVCFDMSAWNKEALLFCINFSHLYIVKRALSACIVIGKNILKSAGETWRSRGRMKM